MFALSSFSLGETSVLLIINFITYVKATIARITGWSGELIRRGGCNGLGQRGGLSVSRLLMFI